MTRREQIIQQLLERYVELTDPMSGPATVAGDGGSVALMPRTYTASVRELERLLRVMREDRHRPLVLLPNGTRASVRSLWWHVSERYIRCRHSLKDVPVKRRTKHGKTLLVMERQVKTHFNSTVDKARVEAAVSWLADNWGCAHEPMLPDELRVAA